VSTVRIEAVMRRDYPRLDPAMPIRRAAALLVESGSAAAPVVDESGRLAGVLTQKDCFRPALHASYYQEWKGTVGDHMSVEVHTLPASADLSTAARAFLDHPYRAFPVVEDGRLVGVLRRSDVLAALLRMG